MTRWKFINGMSDRYRISDCGRVQSRHRKGARSLMGDWWDMKIAHSKQGYPLVYLWDSRAAPSKRRVRAQVHKLVAEAFVPNPDGKDSVNHINGVKTDNRASNLEWCTRAENMKHAWRTGLCKPHKLTESEVLEILTCGGTDTDTARRFGVSQVMVTRIRAAKAWKHVSAMLGREVA